MPRTPDEFFKKVMLASEEHFKISTYLVVLNSTVSDLSPRIKAYCKVEK